MSLDTRDAVLAFTDGACSGNPGPGGWAGIILDTEYRVRELGGGEDHTTNNRMEMMAALQVLRETSPSTRLILHTDSSYVVQGITSWVHGWKRKGWRKSGGDEVLNLDLWQALYEEVHTSGRAPRIQWKHVRGHVGIPGNERADRIAVAYSLQEVISLYDGPYEEYGVDLLTIPEVTASSKKKKSSSSPSPLDTSPRRLVYLSYVHGELLEHHDWPSCQRRVSGQSGARYKKCKTQQEVRDTLQKWGLDPNSLS